MSTGDPIYVVAYPHNKGDVVAFTFSGVETLTGVMEDVHVGIARNGFSYISIVRGQEDDNPAQIAVDLSASKNESGQLPGISGDMTPGRFKAARAVTGYRRYTIYTDGGIEIDGGRRGRSIRTNINSPSIDVIPVEDIDELLTALHRNRDFIAVVLSTIHSDGKLDQSRVDEIAAIPKTLIDSLKIHYMKVNPHSSAGSQVDIAAQLDL